MDVVYSLALKRNLYGWREIRSTYSGWVIEIDNSITDWIRDNKIPCKQGKRTIATRANRPESYSGKKTKWVPVIHFLRKKDAAFFALVWLSGSPLNLKILSLKTIGEMPEPGRLSLPVKSKPIRNSRNDRNLSTNQETLLPTS